MFDAAEDLYPNLYAPGRRYVFIVTYGRSGSTVLQGVLNALDGYCIRGENGNLAYNLCRLVATVEGQHNMVMRRRALGLPAGERRAELRDILGTPGDPWYGAEAIEPGRVAARLFDGFVETCLNPPEGTRVAGFKEIRFYHDLAFLPKYLDILRRHFPDARFIMHLRDHDAVLRSGWYRYQFAWKVRPRLRRQERAFLAYAADHPDCCHVMRYEAYKGRPEAFAPLFDFLGEPFDEALVRGILDKKLVHLQAPPAPPARVMLRKIFNLRPQPRRKVRLLKQDV